MPQRGLGRFERGSLGVGATTINTLKIFARFLQPIYILLYVYKCRCIKYVKEMYDPYTLQMFKLEALMPLFIYLSQI